MSELVPLRGQMTVQVKYRDMWATSPLSMLLGYDCCKGSTSTSTVLGPSQFTILHWLFVTLARTMQTFSRQSSVLSRSSRPSCLKDGAKPQFWRPCSMPFAIKESVGREIDHLVRTRPCIQSSTVNGLPQLCPSPIRMGNKHLWAFQGHF